MSTHIQSWVEWRYSELCSQFSPEYLKTCEWYCGPNLEWLYGFEPALFRKYAREPIPVPLPGMRTPLEALWPALRMWIAEAKGLSS